MEVAVVVDPAPDLGAQLGRVLLDDVPERVVGVDHVGVDGGLGAERGRFRRSAGGAAVELQLEAASHHSKLP